MLVVQNFAERNTQMKLLKRWMLYFINSLIIFVENLQHLEIKKTNRVSATPPNIGPDGRKYKAGS